MLFKRVNRKCQIRNVIAALVIAASLCAVCGCGRVVSADPHSRDDTLCDFADDHEQLHKLTTTLIELDKSGLATDIGKLIEQLTRKRCAVLLAEPKKAKVSPAKLYTRCKDSVVAVASLYDCRKCNKMHASVASGFIINADGVIATNYHVADKPDNKAFAVMTADGEIHPVKQILAADEDEDIAILKIDTVGLKPLAIVADEPVGSPVSVISNPSKNLFMMTQGHVSAYLKSTDNDEIDRMYITADFGLGSSGGPVLNRAGNVVAMVCSTIPIYSKPQGRRKTRYAQMVIKSCVTGKALRKIVTTKPR